MTRTTKYLIAAGAVAAMVGLAVSGASYAGGDRHGYRGGHHGMGHHGMGYRGEHAQEMFQRFDQDGDGKVTRAEMEAVRDGKFGEFDGDGDGEMSLDEFQGLWLQMARSRMVDHFQHLDADGDGKITRAEYDRPFEVVMTRMDRNEDGAVTMRELRKRHHGYKDYDDDKDDD